MIRHKRDGKDWFASEVLLHEENLRLWLLRRFPSLGNADDVIQESYFKIMKAHASGPLLNPKAYLFVVAKNIVISRLRHQACERPKGVRELDELSIEDQIQTPLEETIQNDEIRMLFEALRTLPNRCSQVMVLRKIYGYSQQEVAEKLGISVNTVQVQTTQGLKRCKAYFRKMGYRRIGKK